MNERRAWEKKAAREFNIDRHANRAFFDLVWQDVLYERADIGGLTKYEEYEGFVERQLRYRTATLQDSSLPASRFGGAEEKMDVEAKSRQGNMAAQGDMAILDDNAEAHINALSEYLAAIAAVEGSVMYFRRTVVGSRVTDRFSKEEALDFLKAHSTGESPRAAPFDSLPWTDRHFHFSEGSVLEDLYGAAKNLEKHYPWTLLQSVYFILCGGVPRAGSLRVGYGYSSVGRAAHAFGRGWIKIEVEPWMPSQYVREAYCRARELMNADTELGGGSGGSPRSRNMEVFRFVVGKSKIHIVSEEEGLARLEIPPWPEMMKAYNAALSKDDPRRYKEPKRFKRDYKRAEHPIIHTDCGLPGIPSEPKTREENKERRQRLRELLAERNQRGS